MKRTCIKKDISLTKKRRVIDDIETPKRISKLTGLPLRYNYYEI